MKKLLILFVFLGVSMSAMATTVRQGQLKRHLLHEVNKIDTALLKSEKDESLPAPTNDFWVKLLVSKSWFSVPFIGVSLQPEIEMHWKKK